MIKPVANQVSIYDIMGITGAQNSAIENAQAQNNAIEQQLSHLEPIIMQTGTKVRGLKVSINEFCEQLAEVQKIYSENERAITRYVPPKGFILKIKELSPKLVITNADMEARLSEKLGKTVHLLVERCGQILISGKKCFQVGFYYMTGDSKNYSPLYYVPVREMRKNLESLYEINKYKILFKRDQVGLLSGHGMLGRGDVGTCDILDEQQANAQIEKYQNVNWFEVYLHIKNRTLAAEREDNGIDCAIIEIHDKDMEKLIFECVEDAINEIKANKKSLK